MVGTFDHMVETLLDMVETFDHMVEVLFLMVEAFDLLSVDFSRYYAVLTSTVSLKPWGIERPAKFLRQMSRTGSTAYQ